MSSTMIQDYDQRIESLNSRKLQLEQLLKEKKAAKEVKNDPKPPVEDAFVKSLNKIDRRFEQLFTKTEEALALASNKSTTQTTKNDNFLFFTNIDSLQKSLEKELSQQNKNVVSLSSIEEFQKNILEIGIVCEENSQDLEEVNLELSRITEFFESDSKTEKKSSSHSKESKQVVTLKNRISQLKAVFETLDNKVTEILSAIHSSKKQNSLIQANIHLIEQAIQSNCLNSFNLQRKVKLHHEEVDNHASAQAAAEIIKRQLAEKIANIRELSNKYDQQYAEKCLRQESRMAAKSAALQSSHRPIQGKGVNLDLDDEEDIQDAQENQQMSSVQNKVIAQNTLIEFPLNQHHLINYTEMNAKQKGSSNSAVQQEISINNKQLKVIDFDLDGSFDDTSVENSENSGKEQSIQSDSIIRKVSSQMSQQSEQSGYMNENVLKVNSLTTTRREDDVILWKIGQSLNLTSQIQPPLNMKQREKRFHALQKTFDFTETISGDRGSIQSIPCVIKVNKLTPIQYKQLQLEITKDGQQVLVQQAAQTQMQARVATGPSATQNPLNIGAGAIKPPAINTAKPLTSGATLPTFGGAPAAVASVAATPAVGATGSTTGLKLPPKATAYPSSIPDKLIQSISSSQIGNPFELTQSDEEEDMDEVPDFTQKAPAKQTNLPPKNQVLQSAQKPSSQQRLSSAAPPTASMPSAMIPSDLVLTKEKAALIKSDLFSDSSLPKNAATTSILPTNTQTNKDSSLNFNIGNNSAAVAPPAAAVPTLDKPSEQPPKKTIGFPPSGQTPNLFSNAQKAGEKQNASGTAETNPKSNEQEKPKLAGLFGQVPQYAGQKTQGTEQPLGGLFNVPNKPEEPKIVSQVEMPKAPQATTLVTDKPKVNEGIQIASVPSATGLFGKTEPPKPQETTGVTLGLLQPKQGGDAKMTGLFNFTSNPAKLQQAQNEVDDENITKDKTRKKKQSTNESSNLQLDGLSIGAQTQQLLPPKQQPQPAQNNFLQLGGKQQGESHPGLLGSLNTMQTASALTPSTTATTTPSNPLLQSTQQNQINTLGFGNSLGTNSTPLFGNNQNTSPMASLFPNNSGQASNPFGGISSSNNMFGFATNQNQGQLNAFQPSNNSSSWGIPSQQNQQSQQQQGGLPQSSFGSNTFGQAQQKLAFNAPINVQFGNTQPQQQNSNASQVGGIFASMMPNTGTNNSLFGGASNIGPQIQIPQVGSTSSALYKPRGK